MQPMAGWQTAADCILRGRKCDTESTGSGCCGAMLTLSSSSFKGWDQFTFSQIEALLHFLTIKHTGWLSFKV